MKIAVIGLLLLLLSGCDRLYGPLVKSRLDYDAQVTVLYSTGETSEFTLKPCVAVFLGGINQPVTVVELKITEANDVLVYADQADLQDLLLAQRTEDASNLVLYVVPAGAKAFDPSPEKCTNP